jgi:hypothetical protein
MRIFIAITNTGRCRPTPECVLLDGEPDAEREPMRPMRAYEEVVEFIAAGSSPGGVVAFRPSETTRDRVAALVTKEKTGGLSTEETSELDHYLQIEHLMRLAKARATLHLEGD